MLVRGYFESPRRVFHGVSAVNLRALGGSSHYMRLSRDPFTDSLGVYS